MNATHINPKVEALASFGSGNEGRKALVRGTGRSGTKKASAGAVRSIKSRGAQHESARLPGMTKHSKAGLALAKQIREHKGNMTNKQVAEYRKRSHALDAQKQIARRAGLAKGMASRTPAEVRRAKKQIAAASARRK